MHPTITTFMANERADELRRVAQREAKLAGDGWPEPVAAQHRFSRYFRHAGEGHLKSIRRTRRGTGHAGTRVA